MKSQNGTKYAQNYDVILKWITAALRGETLDVIGVKTGRIREVFGFEPADIAVRAGRVDVMVRDDKGALFHIEEQRNLRKADMYRFAAYHFMAAEQWGEELTDIILASGDVYAGEKSIITKSGKYTPMVIDFSLRDGRRRLAEIRKSVQKGDFENWLELVFLPLYGKETGPGRSEMVEDILRFESGLYHAGKMSARVLAAALIMSNKMVSKEKLMQIWEEIKMLDILEIAKEEGMKEGMKEGMREGMKEGKALGILEDRREMVIDAMIEKFSAVPPRTLEQIRAMQNPDVLKVLHRQALKCGNFPEFEAVLRQMQ